MTLAPELAITNSPMSWLPMEIIVMIMFISPEVYSKFAQLSRYCRNIAKENLSRAFAQFSRPCIQCNTLNREVFTSQYRVFSIGNYANRGYFMGQKLPNGKLCREVLDLYVSYSLGAVIRKITYDDTLRLQEVEETHYTTSNLIDHNVDNLNHPQTVEDYDKFIKGYPEKHNLTLYGVNKIIKRGIDGHINTTITFQLTGVEQMAKIVATCSHDSAYSYTVTAENIGLFLYPDSDADTVLSNKPTYKRIFPYCDLWEMLRQFTHELTLESFSSTPIHPKFNGGFPYLRGHINANLARFQDKNFAPYTNTLYFNRSGRLVGEYVFPHATVKFADGVPSFNYNGNNGPAHLTYTAVNGELHGEVRERDRFFERPLFHGTFDHGKPVGVHTTYHRCNGKVAKIDYHEDGKLVKREMYCKMTKVMYERYTYKQSDETLAGIVVKDTWYRKKTLVKGATHMPGDPKKLNEHVPCFPYNLY